MGWGFNFTPILNNNNASNKLASRLMSEASKLPKNGITENASSHLLHCKRKLTTTNQHVDSYTHCFEKSLSSNKQLSAILTTATGGIVTGCLTFVSFVDALSFPSHLQKKNNDLIESHLAIWWPYGRDLMKPLLLSAVVCNAMA